MCAKIAADDNTGADRNTAKEHNQRVNDISSRANSSQSFFTDKVTDYKAVYRIIKILENIADQQRDCKSDQQFCNIAVSHIQGFGFL